MNKIFQQLTNLHNVLATALNQAEKEMMQIIETVHLTSICEENTRDLHIVYQELSLLFSLNLDKIQVQTECVEMVFGIILDGQLESGKNKYPTTSIEVRKTLEEKFIKSGEFLCKLRNAISDKNLEEAFIQYANLHNI